MAISFLTNAALSVEAHTVEVLGYVVRHEDDLKATLTEQQKEIFKKLKDCESELHGMNELESFVSGFKLAARIIIEVLRESPKT